MHKKVFVSKSNEATFVCPKCDKTKTVDVSKYNHVQKRIKVKSRCICGYSWASLLERRKFYRLETDIPCACSKNGLSSFFKSISMKIVDLSPGGLKLESDAKEKGRAHANFFKSPFNISFQLGENKEDHIKKTLHPTRITKTHVCAEFDELERGNSTIISYMLGYTR